MKLHSLDISGFKSFVDPVDLEFAGGITAIVGPNGCGKSNLADAITWVLGEQSAKSLRGSTMEDVIFNGSAKRRPLGMAEVSLTLLADPSFAQAEDGKITLGRRVFRSGQSQYRLNGKVVRLKEIKDLLMDTGLGIRAYSVIEQGKIGMILSGRPQERRKLLEEAAGITRYKARKRIAELKLEETTANLLRLDDIVSEVERSLRSLKRQANAARRYKAREREYRDLLKRVLLGRWSLVTRELARFDRRLAELTGREAELSAVLAESEASLAEGREELDDLARVLAERHEEQAQLAATIEGRQEFLKGSRQRSDEVGERLLMGRTKAEERRRQSSDFRHSLGTLDERSQELIEERDGAARLVAEDDERIAACQRRVEEASRRAEALRDDLGQAVAEIETLRAELQRTRVEVERRTYRRRFLGEERSRLDAHLSEAEATLARVDRRLAELGSCLEERAARRAELMKTLEGLLQRESELSDQTRRDEARVARLEQRRQILTELSEEHEEKRSALVEVLGRAGVAEPRFLADEASPPAGWEGVVDHFLGDMAEAVLLAASDDALALGRRLAELGGSGIFLRQPPLRQTPRKPQVRRPADRVDDPAVLFSLTEALGLPSELGRALPPAFLVATAEDAERLAAQHPGVAFLSRDRLWAAGGALHVQAEEAAPGVLARDSELAAIGPEIEEIEERLEEAAQTLEDLVAERTLRASDANRLDQEIAELQRETAVAHARRQDAEARRSKLADERQAVAGEDSEIAGELAALTGEREQLTERLSRAGDSHAAVALEAEEAQDALEAAKEEREALRTAGAGRRGRLELLEERLESHNQEAARVQRQITYTEEQLAVWSQEDELLQRRLRELESAMKEAEAELLTALERRAGTQESVLEQQELLDAKRAEIRALEGTTHQARDAREELRSQIEEQRVERAGVRQDAEHLSVTYRETFKRALPVTLERSTEAEPAEAPEPAHEAASGEAGAAVPVAASTADREPAADDGGGDLGHESSPRPDAARLPVEEEAEIPDIGRAELAEMEAELARLKAVLERLGPVNVLAAEEYEEQLEREEFLTTQREDVVDSVRRLQATISEINATSSERFRATFAEVNARFGKVFARLFRGGEAEMRLFDEEDILESGIEIIARPPGKRAQNIMLLSGGEKALTAIALLFALFETKPSPFCILDEVDAPLDDVNILRFIETLREMATETQFLIVTHNKLTMEVAATLYGVTMEEQGVSKLVSVELDKAQPVARAAATA